MFSTLIMAATVSAVTCTPEVSPSMLPAEPSVSAGVADTGFPSAAAVCFPADPCIQVSARTPAPSLPPAAIAASVAPPFAPPQVPARTLESTSMCMSSPSFQLPMSVPSAVLSSLFPKEITRPACSAASSPTSNGNTWLTTSSVISSVAPRHSVTQIGTDHITSAPPAPKRTYLPGRYTFSPQNKCASFSARLLPHKSILV